MIYLELFLTFLKIGAFTIGGGMAMIPLISDSCIQKGWLSSAQLIDFIAISEATPGPFAINIGTFVGNEVAGFLGAVAAVFGLFLPSFIIIMFIFKFVSKFITNRHLQNMFKALRPAVVGLIGSALVMIIYNAFFANDINKSVTGIGIAMSIIIIMLMNIKPLKKIHPIVFIVASAGLGILFYGLIGV